MENVEKWALVTGASSGIGKAFAVKLAKEKYNLYLAARRMEKLQELASQLQTQHSIQVIPIQADLSKKEDREKMWEATGGKDTKVELVFNNAGVGWVNPFIKNSIEETRQMLELNVIAVSDLCHFYLPIMVEKKKGTMIVVSSTAAFQPTSYFSAYAASKAFDYFLAEGISRELGGSGVHIMSLCPGATLTEFGGENLDIKSMAGPLAMTAEAVAEICWKGMKRRKKVVVPGFMNRMVIHVQRLVPRSLVNWINAAIFRRVYRQVENKK